MMRRSGMNRERKRAMNVRRQSNVSRSASITEVQVSIVLRNRSETSHFDSAPFEPLQIDSTESVLHSRATQIRDHVERRVRVKGTLISGKKSNKEIETGCPFKVLIYNSGSTT